MKPEASRAIFGIPAAAKDERTFNVSRGQRMQSQALQSSAADAGSTQTTVASF